MAEVQRIKEFRLKCLASPILEESSVVGLYDAKDCGRVGMTIIRRLAMSHERLRVEFEGLKSMFENLDRKVRHGCADAHCDLCDGQR